MIRADPQELVAARRARLDRACAGLGLDSWLFTTRRAVRFATGLSSDDADLAGETAWPIVAVDDAVIQPSRPPSDPALIDDVADLLPRQGRIAVDRLGWSAMERLRQCRPKLEVVDASAAIGAARNPKARCEIDTIVRAVHLTESALVATLPSIVPGKTERELNAELLSHAVERDLDDIHVDTVFAVLPKERSQAPWARGEWEGYQPYRELTGDRELEEGDHVAFDAGFLLDGYASDVGWTIRAGVSEPSARERDLPARWDDVARRVIDAIVPGATSRDLRLAALDGWPAPEPPWPYPLYVVHGVGTDVAEPPFAGVEVGPALEESMVVEEGQVLLVEPYVWEPRAGGYRAEYCVVVEAGGARIVNDLDFGRWPSPDHWR